MRILWFIYSFLYLFLILIFLFLRIYLVLELIKSSCVLIIEKMPDFGINLKTIFKSWSKVIVTLINWVIPQSHRLLPDFIVINDATLCLCGWYRADTALAWAVQAFPQLAVSACSQCVTDCSEIFHVNLGAESNMITIEAVAGCLRFLPIFGSCSGTILSNDSQSERVRLHWKFSGLSHSCSSLHILHP